jgi:hypothetical protein
MGLLNQVIAIEKDVKSRYHSRLSELYHILQKPTLFNGFNKNYEKLAEEDVDLPPENQKVQYRVGDILREVAKSHTEFMDVTSRKDWTNQEATGTIEIDGVSLMTDIPISYLLFLEKQVTDLRTFFSKLPELAIEEDWGFDDNASLYRSKDLTTHRNKKKTSFVVVVPPTAEHPAVVKDVVEDVLAGHWKLVKMSGAMPRPEKEALCERTEKLLLAIKKAREAANTQEEEKVPPVGERIFNFLYAARIGEPQPVNPPAAPVS